MIDTMRDAHDRAGEATLTVKVAGSSPTEPTLNELKWKPRPGEKPEDTPRAETVQDPYSSTGEEERVRKFEAESKEALADTHDEPHRIMRNIPVLQQRGVGLGMEQKWNRPPEEVRAFAVLLKVDQADKDHHQNADFVAINAVLGMTNATKDGTASWSDSGLSGKIAQRERVDIGNPVERVQQAVAAHIANERERFSRSFNPKDVLTIQGLDSCVCAALGSGDVMTALKLIEGAQILLPDLPNAVAGTASRNSLNLRKAYEIYPVVLKRQTDILFASIGNGRLDGIAQAPIVTTLKAESLNRLRQSAMLAQDEWYGNQLVADPKGVRNARNPMRYVDKVIDKSLTSWQAIKSGCEEDATQIVEAQVANFVAAELARRVHPEKTVVAHVDTAIALGQNRPESNNGPTFDGYNEYVGVFGPPSSDQNADKKDTSARTMDTATRARYLSDPNNLDVGAFIRFFKAPQRFFSDGGAVVVSPAVAQAAVERFTAGMQFLNAIMYSGEQGNLNKPLNELVQRQFGIDASSVTIGKAFSVLQEVAPEAPMMKIDYREVMHTRNPSFNTDQQTATDLGVVMKKAVAKEGREGMEAVRQALQQKIEELGKLTREAQKYIDDLSVALASQTQTQRHVSELIDEIANISSARVTRMPTPGYKGKKFGTKEEQNLALEAKNRELTEAKQTKASADMEYIKAKGFDDETAEKALTVKRLEGQIQMLQSFVDQSFK